jgi:diacylglycerol kinase family enzyme
VTQEKLAQVQAELQHVVTELNVVLTERPGHATELASAAIDGGFEAIVVYSGDGGFNEALNGLTQDVPIGFLPGGGTSVLSRALGLPHDPVAAARRLAESVQAKRMRRITVGRVNGRRFAFAAGVGLDAEAVRRVDRMGRTTEGKRPGDLAFARAVVSELAAHTGHMEPAVEVKGFGRAAFAFVANGSPYTYLKRLPLPIVPGAHFEEGLDLIAPIRVRRRSLLPFALSILSGRSRGRRNTLYGHDLDRVEIVCDRPTALQADGEDLGDVEEAIFEAERGAVSVFV